MMFQEVNVNSNAQVIQAIIDFAASVGFPGHATEISGTSVRGTFTASITSGANSPRPEPCPFHIEDIGGGLTISLLNLATTETKLTYILNPANIKAQNGIDTMPPSKVSMFGYHPSGPWAPGQKEPYLGVVITYEFNYYRHLYFGYLQRAGNFQGGEIISGGAGPAFAPKNIDGYQGVVQLRDIGFNHMFGAIGCYSTQGWGGVRVVHPNNPVEFRPFRGSILTGNESNMTPQPVIHVIGGFGDGPNDPLMEMAHAEVCNSQILVPINLYMAMPDTGRYVPIGCPAGVRYVNMRDLLPEQSIALGNDMWRVYPEILRSSETTSRAPEDRFVDSLIKRRQTSQFVGYAYPENPS